MKVEGDSDGDGDMSGGDTERSGGSSRGPDRDSSAEEADEPDSDDSSEMDESECERRRNECLDNLGKFWWETFEVMFTNNLKKISLFCFCDFITIEQFNIS